MTASSSLRLVAANLLTALGYALLARACLALTSVGPGVSPLWLPAGLGLSLLVVAGPRLLPGLWLGYVAGSLWFGTPFYASAIAGLVSIASVWLGAALFQRFLPDGLTGSPSAPARFLAIAYGCAALAGLCGPPVLRSFDVLPPAALDAAIIVWWLGDALGIIVFAPAVLAWREALAGGSWFRDCRLGVIAVVAATLALAALTFLAGRFFLADAHLQAALLLPPMMWLTTRCHPAVPLSVNLVAVVGLVYGATDSLGPLLGPTPVDRAYALHGFVLISSVTLLFLAAHIHQVRRMTAAAQAGEERFRRLTALTSDWYWEQDADCRFSFFDGPVLGDPDSQPPQLVGKRLWELPGVAPFGTNWEAHRADLDARRTFIDLVLRHAHADGRLRYVSISGEPVFDAAGQFAGYRGVGRDVTAEVESRAALQASERQFHEVADATFEGLFIHDFGRIVFANKSLAELVGRSIEDIVGGLVLEFVAPEEQQEIIRQLALDQEVRHYESVGIHADGHRFPVEVFSRPIVFQGKPMRIAAVRDIGARCTIEEALSGQIRFQRTLLDTIPNPVFYKDRAGRYLGYNSAFAAFLRIGPQDYIGKTVFDIAPPELAELYKAADDTLFANPGIQVYEAQIQTPAGRRDAVFHKATFLDDRREVGGLVGIIEDITERKRIEDKLRRFLELSPAAIGILDITGKVLYMNPAASELFGFTLADVPTIEAWWALTYPDAAYREERRAAWFSAVELTLREGRNMLRFDGRVHCRNGRERWIETLASLGEHEIFMIFTDLTDYVEGGKG
ncbi:MAG: hypothetical protein A2045_05475 [Rhodocyclales bacterium GWA2_65_20]|nr:MAG: hypothetical protein A2045_05475 [Rhodocyclales bacterium GWA2_65_20]